MGVEAVTSRRRSLWTALLMAFGAASLAAACAGAGAAPTPTAAAPHAAEPAAATPPGVGAEDPRPLGPLVSPRPAPSPTPTMAPSPPSPTLVPTLAPTAIAGVAPGPPGGAELVVAGRTLRVELALTRDQRTLGLSGRERLDADAGMLFIFPSEGTLTFWMRDTLIPLDLVYLDSDGVVVGVHTMEPEPDTPVSLLRRYPSAAPARYALEVNAGVVRELGIEAGDVIDLSGLAGAWVSSGNP